jgi:transcriptional regulator with XRE-family HTH domain
MVTFGERLRELRNAQGRTQRDLANGIGINFTYLSKLENGVMPPPGEKTISALASVLNADPKAMSWRCRMPSALEMERGNLKAAFGHLSRTP